VITSVRVLHQDRGGQRREANEGRPMLRVLYYEYPGQGTGGSRTSLLNLIRGLQDHVWAHVVADLPPEIASALPANSVTLPASPGWPPKGESPTAWGLTGRWLRHVMKTTARLVYLILRYRIDLVHANNGPTTNAPAILAARITGRPCVCHLRGSDPPYREARWLFRYVDHYIAISRYVRDYYRRRSLLNGKAVSVIYNGLDVAALEAKSHDRLRQHHGRLRVCWFGRIAPDKGVDWFIRVAAETAKRADDVDFIVHGPAQSDDRASGAYYQSLCAVRRDLGSADLVRFNGAYPDVRKVMMGADVVLCTSPGLPATLEEQGRSFSRERTAYSRVQGMLRQWPTRSCA